MNEVTIPHTVVVAIENRALAFHYTVMSKLAEIQDREALVNTLKIAAARFSAEPTTPDARDALIKEFVGALGEIADIKERKKDLYPSDWREQIAACPECQRYKNHPIQQGICDTHRRPIYAQQDYDRHETEILGYRAKDIARAALISAKEAGYVAQEQIGDKP